MLTLDAIKKLDEFRFVFDVDFYRTHLDDYNFWLYCEKSSGDAMAKEIYEKLSPHINIPYRKYHSRMYEGYGNNPAVTKRLARLYWFMRAILYNPCNRSAWGSLGHEILPETLHRWIVKRLKREG